VVVEQDKQARRHLQTQNLGVRAATESKSTLPVTTTIGLVAAGVRDILKAARETAALEVVVAAAETQKAEPVVGADRQSIPEKTDGRTVVKLMTSAAVTLAQILEVVADVEPMRGV
jgi:putative lipase involved disintegration of autophagic bodies